MTQVSLGRDYSPSHPYTGTSPTLTVAVLLLYFPSWSYPPGLYFINTLILENHSDCRKSINSLGDITNASSVSDSRQCAREPSAAVRHLESKTCRAKESFFQTSAWETKAVKGSAVSRGGGKKKKSLIMKDTREDAEGMSRQRLPSASFLWLLLAI